MKHKGMTVTIQQLRKIYALQKNIGMKAEWNDKMSYDRAEEKIRELTAMQKMGAGPYDEWTDEAIARKLRELQ